MKKILILTCALLFGCSPDDSPSNITPSIDRVGQEMTVKVFFYPDSTSLEEAYRTVNNLSARVPVPEQWGFARWNEWRAPSGEYIEPNSPRYWCNIYTMTPKRREDQHVLTLGHELLHCVYGSYHE
jgi:hypothetical protein